MIDVLTDSDIDKNTPCVRLVKPNLENAFEVCLGLENLRLTPGAWVVADIDTHDYECMNCGAKAIDPDSKFSGCAYCWGK